GYEPRDVQELRHWSEFLRLLVDHHGGSDAAIRVTTATDLTPIGARSVNQIREVCKRAHQRKREPVASGFGDSNLTLHIVGQMRQRVSLTQSALRSNVFVTSCK